MLNHRKNFEKLGAKLTTGFLMFRETSHYKTLMVNRFVKVCRFPCYFIQRYKSVEFMGSITYTFHVAKNAASSIILLDDMDKLSNEDEAHVNTSEYIAVQTRINELRSYDVVNRNVLSCYSK